MVILMNDLPKEVSAQELRELVERYYPVKEVNTLQERRRGVDWRVDLGNTDREVANFVTEHLNGHYWRGCYLNAYCPLYQ
jgi:hypothetical protein